MTEVAVSQKEIDFTKNEEIEIQASEPVKLEENFKAMTTTEVSTDNWCQENKENQKNQFNAYKDQKNNKQGYKKNYYNNQYLWDSNYGQYHANNHYYYNNRDQNKTGYQNKAYMPRYYPNKTHQSFQKAPEDSEYIKYMPKKDNNKMQNQGPYRVPKNYQRSQELALVPELPDSEPEQRRKLFIGGLSYETDDKSLFDHFSSYGDLTDCVVMKDPRTKRSRGFGFVCFAKSEDLETCMADRPHEIHNRPVEPKRAVSRLESAKPGANLSAYKLWISGFDPEKLSGDDFREYFSKYGKINSIDIPKNKETGQLRNFAFVIFDDYDVVDRIIADSKKRIQERQRRAVPELDSKAGSEKSSGTNEKETNSEENVGEKDSGILNLEELNGSADIDSFINNMHPVHFKQTNIVHEHMIKGFTIAVNKGFTSEEMKDIKSNLLKKQAAQDRNKQRYNNQLQYQYNYNYMGQFRPGQTTMEKLDRSSINKSKSSSGNSSTQQTPDKPRGKTHAGFVKSSPPNVPSCRLVGSHVTHNPPHLNNEGSKGSTSPVSNEYQYYAADQQGHQYYYHHYYYGNYTAVYPDGYNYQKTDANATANATAPAQAYHIPTYPNGYTYQQGYIPEQVNPSPGLFIPGATNYYGQNNYYQSTGKNVPNRFKNRQSNFQKYRGNKEGKQEQQQQVTTDESNEHIGSDQAE